MNNNSRAFFSDRVTIFPGITAGDNLMLSFALTGVIIEGVNYYMHLLTEWEGRRGKFWLGVMM